MKLANALLQRSDIQGRLEEMRLRLKNNALVQEGDTPAEDPAELIKEANAMFDELEKLITRINLTNNTTVTKDGVTLSALLAHRDCLKSRLSMLRNFVDAAGAKVDRYSQKEIKILSTVNVRTMQKQVDKIAKELRETDETIQELNWTVELK